MIKKAGAKAKNKGYQTSCKTAKRAKTKILKRAPKDIN
jgi:hypothetical protein